MYAYAITKAVVAIVTYFLKLFACIAIGFRFLNRNVSCYVILSTHFEGLPDSLAHSHPRHQMEEGIV